MSITVSYMASRKDALEASAAEQFELAGHLREAANTDPDFKTCCVEAAMFYRAAAEKGHVEAQFELGSMYQFGIGVEKNNFQAAKWYRRAAKQGHGEAMCRLANLYQRGLGMRKNGLTALFWKLKYVELCKSRQEALLGEGGAGLADIKPPGQLNNRSTAMRNGRGNGGPNNA